MNSTKLLSSLGSLSLLASICAAQGADDCVNATPIAGFGVFAFDNTTATASGIADCAGLPVRKDVWFAWTAPVTGSVRYETCGTTTGFDTRIVAYDGADCNALTVADCAASTCNGLSRVSFDAVAGQTYLLRTGSRAVGQGGPGQIRLEVDPCPQSADDVLEQNDTCMDRVTIVDGTYNNLWCSKTDTDWYAYCVAPGDTLTIDLNFINANGNVDIWLQDDCSTIGNLGVSAGMTDTEHISWTNMGTSDVEVYAEVEIWPSAVLHDCNTYSMTVTGANGACGDTGIGTNYCMANPNSTGSIASIGATGSDVAADNDLTLGGTSLPANSFSFFLASQTTGFVMNPAGSAGNLCVAGNIGRYVGPGQIQQADLSGTIALTIDLTMIPQPNGFVAAVAGDTWNFQAWYRDMVGGMATSNFTDGLTVLFQ